MLQPSRQDEGSINSTDASWLHSARNDTGSTDNTNSSQARKPKGERKVLRLVNFTMQVRTFDGQQVNDTAFEEIIETYLVREMIFTNLVRVTMNVMTTSMTKSDLLDIYTTTLNCSGTALFIATPNIDDEEQKSSAIGFNPIGFNSGHEQEV